MLQPGTSMADVDRTVEDAAEEFSCEFCGEDAENCLCFDEDYNPWEFDTLWEKEHV